MTESILGREQLKKIGVTKMGHVNRLIRAIEKLRSGDEGEEVHKEPVETWLHQTSGEDSRHYWCVLCMFECVADGAFRLGCGIPVLVGPIDLTRAGNFFSSQ